MPQEFEALFKHGAQQRIKHAPVSDVASGTLLFFGTGIKKLVGVTTEPLAANKPGDIEITGIYMIRKKAGIAFGLGAPVSWDNESKQAVPAGDTDETEQLGVCVGAALAGDDGVLVRINMVRGNDLPQPSGGGT